MRHAPSRTRRSAAGAACASLSGRACARSGEHEHVPPMDGLAEAPTHDGERVRRASALSGNRQIIAWHCRPLCTGPFGAACALKAHALRRAGVLRLKWIRTGIVFCCPVNISGVRLRRGRGPRRHASG